jgi:hypothetical protein
VVRSSLARWLYRSYLITRYRVLPPIGHELMRHRNPSQIVSRWPDGEIPLGGRVCVFAHWDGAGDVRPHVMQHVRSLAAAGMSVMFVTNAGMLRPDVLEALKLVCAGVIIRRNVGYDFGAWREGIGQLGLPRPNTAMVVIANDSVYGPLRSLDELFAAVDFEAADVWGCTDSWQSRYHLQSYLMAFSPRVVASEAWRKYWAGVVPTWSKTWLIRLYEIGLTQALLRAGFNCRAIWPYKNLVADIDVGLLNSKRLEEAEIGPDLADPIVQARRRHALRLREAVADRTPLNPTSDLWRQLLKARFPFIKRELLRDNPSRVPDVAEWRDAVSEIAETSLAPIERDLQRTLRNRAP